MGMGCKGVKGGEGEGVKSGGTGAWGRCTRLDWRGEDRDIVGPKGKEQ